MEVIQFNYLNIYILLLADNFMCVFTFSHNVFSRQSEFFF